MPRPKRKRRGAGLLQEERRKKAAQEIFNHLDKDRSGYLDMEELESGMRSLGTPVTRGQVLSLFAREDINKDGKISFEEFFSFCNSRMVELRRVFDSVHLGSNGTLTSEEVKHSIEALGFNVSGEQVRNMMQRFQRQDSSEGLSFDDFTEMIVLLPPINPQAVFESFQQMPLDGADNFFQLPRNARTGLKQSVLTGIVCQLYSGGMASIISRTLTAPIERLKVLAQVASPGAPSLRFFSGIRSMYADGGLVSLYRGNGASLIKIVPETAVKLAAFEFFKLIIAKDPGNSTQFERLVAGGAAGAIAITVVYPLEVAKTRLSVCAGGSYRSLGHCLSTILWGEGPRALFKGLGPTLLAVIPYASIEMTVHAFYRVECLVQAMTNCGGRRQDWMMTYYKIKRHDPDPGTLIAGGALAGCSAMVATYPLQLARTRLQASGSHGLERYRGLGDCLWRTLQAEGPLGLYRGLVPSMLRVVPATAISFFVFRQLDRPFTVRNPNALNPKPEPAELAPLPSPPSP